MNERIKMLAGKALDDSVPRTWTTLTHYDVMKFSELFAKIIAKECADLCVRFQQRSMEPAECAGAIRQMFDLDSNVK